MIGTPSLCVLGCFDCKLKFFFTPPLFSDNRGPQLKVQSCSGCLVQPLLFFFPLRFPVSFFLFRTPSTFFSCLFVIFSPWILAYILTVLSRGFFNSSEGFLSSFARLRFLFPWSGVLPFLFFFTTPAGFPPFEWRKSVFDFPSLTQ